MKTITLKKTGYLIKGVADLTSWGGGKGCILMKPFRIGNIQKKTLLANINDNGFGVENINGAICDIYEDFEGTLQYYKTLEVGKISEFTKNFYDEQGYIK